MLNFSGRRRLPVILQSEACECGLACLAMIASFYGHRIDLNTLRRQHLFSLNGVTLKSLVEIARHLKLASRAVRLEPDDLKQLKLPAVLHWDMNHFVVLQSVKNNGVVLHDPALGEKRMSWTEACKHLTGVALELTPTADFERKDERSRLGLSTFLKQASGAKHAIFQLLALSLALELLVIAGPFYLQLTVDEVIARGDVDLLVVLALGFALVAVLTVAVTWLRSVIVVFPAELAPLCLRRASVSPPDPAAAFVLREAAYRRRPLPLQLGRTCAQPDQRRFDPRPYRRRYGGSYACHHVPLQRKARANRVGRIPASTPSSDLVSFGCCVA